jgi:hypothetical protein
MDAIVKCRPARAAPRPRAHAHLLRRCAAPRVLLLSPLLLLLLVAPLPPAHAAPQPMCLAAAPCRLKCAAACDELASRSGRGRVMIPGLGATPLNLQGAAADPAFAPEGMPGLIRRAAAAAEAKAEATVAALRTDQYPMATLPSGQWETVRPGHWMSGLFVGVMWQLYELTNRTKPEWKDRALLWQAALADRQRDFGAQHDFGGRARQGVFGVGVSGGLVSVGMGLDHVGVESWLNKAAPPRTLLERAWPTRREGAPAGPSVPTDPASPAPFPGRPSRAPGFIYLPSFAYSYSVTKSTEDLRQALAAAEVCVWEGGVAMWFRA